MNSTNSSYILITTVNNANDTINNTVSPNMNESRSGDEEEEANANIGIVYYSIFFDFVVPGILLNIIGLLGLIGNTLSIIVLSRPQMRQSINCILIGLASFDSILIVTSILMLGLPAVYDFLIRRLKEHKTAPGIEMFHFYFSNVFPFITPTVYPIAMIVQTGSVYLTIAVTLERFVAVCLPFRSRSLCTYGRARYGVILVALCATVYNLPRFWEITWKNNYYGPNMTEYAYTEVITTELRQDPTYIGVYYTWAYLFFMFFIPFSCLAILNMLIYKQVRKANSERSRMSRQEQKEIGLATMLLVVVIVFFICNVLALVVNILEHLFQKELPQMTNVNNLLVTFNSSVNFIIYCIFNDKFKRIFCKLFCCELFLHKFGIYSNVGAGATETYVHRYPENGIRLNTTTTSAPGTLLHNIHNVRGSSPRLNSLIEAPISIPRNSVPHLNNNGNLSCRGGIHFSKIKNNEMYKETENLLLKEGVLSDEEEEYCILQTDTQNSKPSGFSKWKKNKKQLVDFNLSGTNRDHTIYSGPYLSGNDSLGMVELASKNDCKTDSQLNNDAKPKKKKRVSCKKLSLISKKKALQNHSICHDFDNGPKIRRPRVGNEQDMANNQEMGVSESEKSSSICSDVSVPKHSLLNGRSTSSVKGNCNDGSTLKTHEKQGEFEDANLSAISTQATSEIDKFSPTRTERVMEPLNNVLMKEIVTPPDDHVELPMESTPDSFYGDTFSSIHPGYRPIVMNGRQVN